MKYLSNYVEEKQTKLFNDLWIFFAFWDKQFEEQKKDWVEYVWLFGWMCCPKDNVKEFTERHSKIIDEWIQEDIKENWLDKIIERELANFECYYTGDIQEAVERLEDYWIEYKKVLEVFRTTKENHDF